MAQHARRQRHESRVARLGRAMSAYELIRDIGRLQRRQEWLAAEAWRIQYSDPELAELYDEQHDAIDTKLARLEQDLYEIEAHAFYRRAERGEMP
jgi:hypothetical protein